MFFRYCWKALAWALFILIICILPGREIPEVKFHNLDKVIHFFLYLILGWLLISGFVRQTSIPSFRCFACSWSLILCIAYGGILELVQHYFIPDRTGDWIDFFTNAGSSLLISVICAVKYKSL